MALLESDIKTAPNTPPASEKSLGDLFADLSRETSTLVREEVRLAQVEMTQKATRLGKASGMIVAGGFVVYAGLLAIVAGIALALVAMGMAPWIAAILVGAAFAIIGGLLAMQGISTIKHLDPIPRQTLETLKEDKEWLKTAR
jgi:uncharacterized membrane protein YqjE